MVWVKTDFTKHSKQYGSPHAYRLKKAEGMKKYLFYKTQKMGGKKNILREI